MKEILRDEGGTSGFRGGLLEFALAYHGC